MTNKPITNFMLQHYKHFNAATLVDAAEAYVDQLANGHKMMITLAGAMSTAAVSYTHLTLPTILLV